METAFKFRPYTIDQGIFQHVVEENEYNLPDRFDPDDIIVDIGTHIGSFSYAALIRGAGRVYGFEPFLENFDLATQNLAQFGDRVQIQHKAVWRSDSSAERLYFRKCPLEGQTAAGVAFAPTHEELDVPRDEDVEVILFDDLVRDASGEARQRIKLLKIDCEGSEFPILLTSKSLPLIDTIVGEFHEMGGAFDNTDILPNARVEGFDRFTIDELAAFLDRTGFDVTWFRNPNDPVIGGFTARNKLINAA
jgi:FkbM family methyltransferase